MSAVAAIVLPDAQATPVDHTFIPRGPDSNGVWWFEDQTGASSLGFNLISLQLSRPTGISVGTSAGQRVNRVKIGLHTPVLETLGTNDAGFTPPSTVAYVNRCNVDFILPERDTVQDRKDLRKFMAGLLANSQVVAMVETLTGIY
jgi:hypothetical protein